jgi:hypothetical protein
MTVPTVVYIYCIAVAGIAFSPPLLQLSWAGCRSAPTLYIKASVDTVR